MEVIKELASNDKSYRSLTESWFKNSPLLEMIQKSQQLGFKIILTTDHGTINVKNPSKVIGDRNVNDNLRYKQGKNLNFSSSDVFEIKNPKEYFLPIQNVSSKYIFAKEKIYFVYQNNYNQFVKYYKDTYQHGGISMEEMLLPFIILKTKVND